MSASTGTQSAWPTLDDLLFSALAAAIVVLYLVVIPAELLYGFPR